MTSLADLRGRLRIVLEDAAAEGYLWSDGALNRHIADAVSGYAALFPREQSTDIATVVDQAAYNLPAGWVVVLQVRHVYADGTEELLVEGGDAFGVGWEVWNGQLVVLPTPEAVWTARVRYLGAHAALASDGDVSSVPGGDEELVIVQAAARALDTLGIGASKGGGAEAGTVAAASAVMWGRWGSGVSARLKRGRSRSLIRR